MKPLSNSESTVLMLAMLVLIVVGLVVTAQLRLDLNYTLKLKDAAEEKRLIVEDAPAYLVESPYPGNTQYNLRYLVSNNEEFKRPDTVSIPISISKRRVRVYDGGSFLVMSSMVYKINSEDALFNQHTWSSEPVFSEHENLSDDYKRDILISFNKDFEIIYGTRTLHDSYSSVKKLYVKTLLPLPGMGQEVQFMLEDGVIAEMSL